MSQVPQVSRRTAIAIAVAAACGPAVASSASRELVSYRCLKWRSAHFKKPKDAKTYISMMKKLGCEAKEQKHGDHVDVKYRCADWRRVELKTHADAHKMEAWLKQYRFETKHQH